MYKTLLICCSLSFSRFIINPNRKIYLFFLLNFSSQVDQEIEEVDVRTKEQANNIQQLIDDTDKMKSLSAKEMRLVHQQNQQNDRLNEEIRNVLNLTVFEEAKLARGQIDE